MRGASRSLSTADFEDYLKAVRALVVDSLGCYLPEEDVGGLYRLVWDYPMRPAKCLRPALCVATAALGGASVQEALPTATALELYHNAFLIHDDIEDGSLLRRGGSTLHTEHGIPIALNVGDSLLALALQPLLENTAALDLGRALRILQLIADMARQTAEGQAIELGWIQGDTYAISDDAYVDMVTRKTALYTFVTPVHAGAIIGTLTTGHRKRLLEFAHALGVGFQIRDDVLNLIQSAAQTGKEQWGDLREGKRTLILGHFFRTASPAAQQQGRLLLTTLQQAERTVPPGLLSLLSDLEGRSRLKKEDAAALREMAGCRTVDFEEAGQTMYTLLMEQGSVVYAQAVADQWRDEALAHLSALDDLLCGHHGCFIQAVADYCVGRTW